LFLDFSMFCSQFSMQSTFQRFQQFPWETDTDDSGDNPVVTNDDDNDVMRKYATKHMASALDEVPNCNTEHFYVQSTDGEDAGFGEPEGNNEKSANSVRMKETHGSDITRTKRKHSQPTIDPGNVLFGDPDDSGDDSEEPVVAQAEDKATTDREKFKEKRFPSNEEDDEDEERDSEEERKKTKRHHKNKYRPHHRKRGHMRHHQKKKAKHNRSNRRRKRRSHHRRRQRRRRHHKQGASFLQLDEAQRRVEDCAKDKVTLDYAAKAKIAHQILRETPNPLKAIMFRPVGTSGGLELNELEIEDMPDFLTSRSVGLKRGDIVLSIQGHDVSSKTELSAQFDKLAPGSIVALEVEREGERLPILFELPGGQELSLLEARQLRALSRFRMADLDADLSPSAPKQVKL